MTGSDRALLLEKLPGAFPGQFESLSKCLEPTCWTKTYILELIGGEIFYVKGTPRSRQEALTTSILYGYCPGYIPRVLEEDFLPGHPWRWFLLENAGKCQDEGLSLECTVDAAYFMGRLQKAVCNEPYLREYLPQCRSDQLQQAALDACDWALQSAPLEARAELESLQSSIAGLTAFFQEIGKELAHLPATCVHGDLWSGNIACGEGTVRFIDWGDALWGVGSISIANLLATSSDEIKNHSGTIWEAYFRGWEVDPNEEFISASGVAELVGNLVVDVEIAKSCSGTLDILPGLVPTLRRLVGV